MAAETIHYTHCNSFPLPSRQQPQAAETSGFSSMPLSQQALAQEQHKEWVDELLDGPLRLLDLCSTAKDIAQQTKESVNELQSVLCRRKSGELELLSEEVEAVTSSMIDSLLSLISGPKPRSWSLVSKLLHHKEKREETGRDINEFEKLDASLKSLTGQKMRESENIINVEMQNQLKDLELCIQDHEDGPECVLKYMIKAKVFILNILNL
ncbi:hypothetical protein DITRI_Ditri08aG0146800 [Diplodiscus trichospermus]